MNREQKRAMQRAGQLNADGTQATTTKDRRAPAQSVKAERTKPAEFVREVRGELRKVTWPTRAEVIRLSTIVLVALVVFTAFVFGFDWLFGEFFSWLLQTGRTATTSGG
jgi:preprotein translocase subunit SecE